MKTFVLGLINEDTQPMGFYDETCENWLINKSLQQVTKITGLNKSKLTYFSAETFVGTQKNHLKSFEHPKHVKTDRYENIHSYVL